MEDEAGENQSSKAKLPLKLVPGVCGYHAVFVPGHRPTLILKEASSLPRRISIRGDEALDVAKFRSREGHESIATIAGDAYLSQIRADTRFGDTGWAVWRAPQHEQVTALCYHSEHDLYAVCVDEPSDFVLPEDEDWHPEWSKEGQ